MDWASRHVLAWRVSNTLDAGFCVEALDEALTKIFNTDQGEPVHRLRGFISMDEFGRCMDIERLSSLSLKSRLSICYDLADGFERLLIDEWIGFYNQGWENPSRSRIVRYRGQRKIKGWRYE